MDILNNEENLILTREMIKTICDSNILTIGQKARKGLCFFVCDDFAEISQINIDKGNIAYFYEDNFNVLIVENCETQMTEVYSKKPLKAVGSMEDEEGLFEEVFLKKLCLTNLDLTNVKSMRNWFYGAKIETVDFTKVKTPNLIDMSGMFGSCEIKNIIWGDISTLYVTNMSGMFSSCDTKELLLSTISTTRVEDMSEMFDDCWAKKIDCSNFDTRNVTNMDCMFCAARVEELDLSGFNTSKVTNMDLMFSDCDVKYLNIKNFNMSNVESHEDMFFGCEAKLIAKDKKVIDIYRRDTEIDVEEFDYRHLSDILNAKLENLDVDMYIIEKIMGCTRCEQIKHLWVLSDHELCYTVGLTNEELEKVLDEMEKIVNVLNSSPRRLNDHIMRCRKNLLHK